jgi:hypothetical protein
MPSKDVYTRSSERRHDVTSQKIIFFKVRFIRCYVIICSKAMSLFSLYRKGIILDGEQLRTFVVTEMNIGFHNDGKLLHYMTLPVSLDGAQIYAMLWEIFIHVT